MSITIITPEETRKARISLCLSQVQISEAIGMHRTKYALFEVNRYIFTEFEQKLLKKHFESLGYAFPEKPQPKKPPTPAYRVLQGIAVPNQIPTEKAQKAMGQVAKHDAYIRSESNKLSGQHWFTEEPRPEVANKIIELMAYNYAHLRWLMGLDRLMGDEFAQNMEPEKTTNAALVNQRLYGQTKRVKS